MVMIRRSSWWSILMDLTSRSSWTKKGDAICQWSAMGFVRGCLAKHSPLVCKTKKKTSLVRWLLALRLAGWEQWDDLDQRVREGLLGKTQPTCWQNEKKPFQVAAGVAPGRLVAMRRPWSTIGGEKTAAAWNGINHCCNMNGVFNLQTHALLYHDSVPLIQENNWLQQTWGDLAHWDWPVAKLHAWWPLGFRFYCPKPRPNLDLTR